TGSTAHVQVKEKPSVSAEVLMALVEDGLTSQVKRGENDGRTLHHVAVARQLGSLGRLDREGFSVDAPLTLPKDSDRSKLQVVAFVQEVGTGKVLAVQTVPLP